MTYKEEVCLLKPLMNFLSLWPTPDNRSSTVKFGIILCMVINVMLPTFAGHLFAKNDREFMDTLTGVLVCVLCIYELCMLRYKKEAVQAILDWMKENWSKNQCLSSRVYMSRWARGGQTMLIFNYLISLAVCIGVFLQPVIVGLLTNTSMRKIGNSPWFPFNIVSSPNFEIVMLLEYTGTFFACSVVAAADGFMIVTIFHLCGQISILCHALRNYNGQVRHLSGTHCDKVQTKCGHLKCIVDNHIKLIRVTKQLDAIVNIVILIRMGFSVIQICGAGYITSRVQKLNLAVSLLHGSYMVVVYFFNFIYCWLGEQLLRTGEKIFYMVYQGDWYELRETHANRALLMVMGQAKIPIRITVGKYFTLSLELFNQFLTMSVSYLSVVITVRQHNT